MSSDVAIYSASVPDRMRYAEALSGASLLPAAYRGKPANVLLALEYGAALGIAPMVAIQGIHVIEGKPSASSGLIGALVRKAGHRMRVTGDDRAARCEITRVDDPDFTFVAEWSMSRAQAAGLTSKQVWKNYPAAMLKARAITECARDACPEALSGVQYTAEELGDDSTPAESYPHGPGVGAGEAGASTELRAAESPVAPAPDIVDAELVVEDEPSLELTRPVERLTATDAANEADPWATTTPALDATREAMALPARDRSKPTVKQVQLVAIRASEALKAANVPVTTESRCVLVSEQLQRGVHAVSLNDLAVVEVRRFLDADGRELSGLVTTLCARGLLVADPPDYRIPDEGVVS